MAGQSVRGFLIVGLGLLFLCHLPTHSSAKPVFRGCVSVYKNKFKPGRVHKAFATSGGLSVYGNYALNCGWGEGYPSKAQAIRAAL